jgi:hypothetical protein
VGGWLAGSLALLSDAGHMATDAAALGLALFAQWIARRPRTRLRQRHRRADPRRGRRRNAVIDKNQDYA